LASTSGDSRRNKSLRETAKNDLRIEKVVIESLMSAKDGRRWLWRTLGMCEVYSTGPIDPNAQVFLAGTRNVGNQLHAQIMRWAPKQLALLLEENSSAIKTEEEEDERPEPDTAS
jgi:hypothetical protein